MNKEKVENVKIAINELAESNSFLRTLKKLSAYLVYIFPGIMLLTSILKLQIFVFVAPDALISFLGFFTVISFLCFVINLIFLFIEEKTLPLIIATGTMVLSTLLSFAHSSYFENNNDNFLNKIVLLAIYGFLLFLAIRIGNRKGDFNKFIVPAQTQIQCAKCARVNPAGQNFCFQCGNPLPPPQPQAPVQPYTPPAAPQAQTPLQQPYTPPAAPQAQAPLQQPYTPPAAPQAQAPLQQPYTPPAAPQAQAPLQQPYTPPATPPMQPVANAEAQPIQPPVSPSSEQ